MGKLFHKLYLVPGVDIAFGHQLRARDFKQVVVSHLVILMENLYILDSISKDKY